MDAAVGVYLTGMLDNLDAITTVYLVLSRKICYMWSIIFTIYRYIETFNLTSQNVLKKMSVHSCHNYYFLYPMKNKSVASLSFEPEMFYKVSHPVFSCLFISLMTYLQQMKHKVLKKAV